MNGPKVVYHTTSGPFLKKEEVNENTKTWFMLLEFYYFNLG